MFFDRQVRFQEPPLGVLRDFDWLHAEAHGQGLSRREHRRLHRYLERQHAYEHYELDGEHAREHAEDGYYSPGY